jgi:PAS domain S-box-containing protein
MYAKPGPDGKAAQLRGIMVDITEIKATEEALRESRRLLQTTLYSLRDAVFIMNLERGEILECNPAATEMFGYHREEMVGQGPRFLHVDAAALQEFRERLACAVAEKGYLEQFEFQMRRKDGNVFPTSHTVTPLRDGRGKQTGWVSLVQDITDRKRTEEALHQSEQRYRDFISYSNEGVWRLELEQPVPLDLPEEESVERILQYGYVAECNLAHARNLGLSAPEELLGKRLGDLIPPRGLGKETIGSFRSAVRGGFQCRTVAFRTFDKRGQPKYLLRTETPMVENGRLVRVWGITRDVTELKLAEEQLRKSEERWRAVFENSAAGIGLSDLASGRILSTNVALQKMLGYSEEELLALSFLDITYEGDREANRRLLTELREGKRSSFKMQKRYRCKDHSLIWASVHVSILPGTESIPRLCMAIVENVTERKRAQEELQHSFEQLRALTARLQVIREEERKSVAREIHDELGQALTAIKIDLASLMRELPADQQQQWKRPDSILELVDQTIQSVRRISAELRPGILDDLGLVAAVEWATEEFEARTGTRCRLDLPGNDIEIDQESATAMFRIFQETLTNVARHANASEVGVRLAKENGDLTLEVHDNGIGIGAKQLSDGRSFGILGMRERAALLGGKLTIIAAPEKGTTVRVRIPVAHCA